MSEPRVQVINFQVFVIESIQYSYCALECVFAQVRRDVKVVRALLIYFLSKNIKNR